MSGLPRRLRPQLRPLMSLRWRMVREAGTRRGLLALLALVLLAAVAALVAGLSVPASRAPYLILVVPTLLGAFVLVAVVSPLTAGGGYQLFPTEQLVAFPLRTSTAFHSSLLLTPLNLAWLVQVLAMLGLTGFLLQPFTPRLLLSVVTLLVYLALATVVGLAVAWGVIGLRQTARGRVVSWLLLAVLSGFVVWLVRTDRVVAWLDNLPTTQVVVAMGLAKDGSLAGWATRVAVMVAVTVVAYLLGRAACGWALRRPGDLARLRTAESVRRAAPPASVADALVRTDRASVWRSLPLRRGLLVIAVVPALVGAVARLQWESIVLLPGFVAASAALLFGVNAFALDGGGALWLSSQPLDARAAFRSKARVVAETVGLAVGCTLVGATLGARDAPAGGQLATVVAAAAAATVSVVATAMTLAVRHPHRADLQAPRDMPAPPGSLAAYSVRLAVGTTLLSVVYAGLAALRLWEAAVLLTAVVGLFAARRLLRASRTYAHPAEHARVATSVAAG